MPSLLRPTEAVLPPADRIRIAVSRLPTISLDCLPPDECCAICLMPFNALCPTDLSDGDGSWQGITKLDTCGHIFCKKDLVDWITSMHGSCPTCRNTFLDISPPSESDDESSDEEYTPPSDDEIDGGTDYYDSEDEGSLGMDWEQDDPWTVDVMDADRTDEYSTYTSTENDPLVDPNNALDESASGKHQ